MIYKAVRLYIFVQIETLLMAAAGSAIFSNSSCLALRSILCIIWDIPDALTIPDASTAWPLRMFADFSKPMIICYAFSLSDLWESVNGWHPLQVELYHLRNLGILDSHRICFGLRTFGIHLLLYCILPILLHCTYMCILYDQRLNHMQNVAIYSLHWKRPFQCLLLGGIFWYVQVHSFLNVIICVIDKSVILSVSNNLLSFSSLSWQQTLGEETTASS